MSVSDPSMALLFRPASIAIVGASADASKASGATFKNLLTAGYTGQIYPVNPRGGEIEGLTVYPSILDVPAAPDLVVIVVPPDAVGDILEDSGRRGAKVALVGVSGFAEAGERGQARQDRLVQIAQRYGMRICGPNCNGVYNVLENLPIGYNSSHSERLPAGGTAIVAQSSAVLGSLAHKAKRIGLGLSYLAGVGNEADWEMCDYLEFCLDDESTRAIGLIIEGLRDGHRFLRLVSEAHARNKHVVALKLGRSEHGALVARAHTARMAGVAEVYDAAFRQHGVISTYSIESFLGALQLVSEQPPLGQGRLMALCSTGAGAELLADRAVVHGVPLAEISEDVRAGFPERRFAALLTNPFDTTGQARDPGFLPMVCSLFASDPGNDCLVLLLLELAVREQFAEAFSEAAVAAGKPAMAIVGEVGEKTIGIFRSHGLPVFDSIDACVGAIKAITSAGQPLTRPDARQGDSADSPRIEATARARALGIVTNGHAAFLPESESKRLLAEYGLRSAQTITARGLRETQAAAREIGLPVILKAVTDRLLHKADAGLVSGCISDLDQLEGAYRAIQANARGLVGDSESVEVSVEEFVSHEFEAILGIKHDPVFGPVLLFGLGGVFTELIGDYAVRLAGLRASEVEEMLSSVRFSALLAKAQAQGKIDRPSLVDAILRLSVLAQDLDGHISALDMNPVALLPRAAGGIKVLDAKAELLCG